MRKSVTIMMMAILLVAASSDIFAFGGYLDKYPLGRSNHVGIAYDSKNNVFYVENEPQRTIFVYEAATFAEVRSFPIPFSSLDYVLDMVFDGTNLWYIPFGAGMVYASTTNGDSVTAFDSGLNGAGRGLGWDGTNLWIGDNNSGKMFKFGTDGALLDSLDLAVSFYQTATIVANSVWINDDRSNFKAFDLTTGAQHDVIPTPISWPWGIANDGTYLYTLNWGDPFVFKVYIGMGPEGEYPKAIINLQATADEASPNSIFLSWTNPTESLNDSPETIASVNIYNYDTDELIANTGSAVENYEVTGLTQGQPYTLYVRAVDVDGNVGAYSGEKVTEIAGKVIPKGGLMAKVDIPNQNFDLKWPAGIAWDGEYLWVGGADQGGYYAKVDTATMDSIGFLNYRDGYVYDSWTVGACFADGMLYSLEYGTGDVYEADPVAGDLTGFYFETHIDWDGDNENDARGIAWDGTNFWIAARALGDAVINQFYVFDKVGIPLKIVYSDSAIDYARGLEWVNDQLWILDSGPGVLRIFDYDGADSLKQEKTVGYWWENWPLDLTWDGDSRVYVCDWYDYGGWILNSGFKKTAVDNSQPQIVQKFELHQNYPNPFNTQTTISYTLAENVKVTLEVYNLLGQKITTLVDKTQKAGKHIATWKGLSDNGDTATSGIYFYKIVAGNFKQIRKMMLIR